MASCAAVANRCSGPIAKRHRAEQHGERVRGIEVEDA
jgi:hypothetical protein